MVFELIANEPGRYVLSKIVGAKLGPWTKRKYVPASPDELRALGLEVGLIPKSQQVTVIGSDPACLVRRNCEVIWQEDGVFLLRKVASGLEHDRSEPSITSDMDSVCHP